MNHIFWDVDKITIMTDVTDATIHRHAMMQFFVCTEGKLDIKVGKEQPDAKCVLVNKNVVAYAVISLVGNLVGWPFYKKID